MSDDLQDKTEDATAKKLADARKKGQVAKSQDLTASALMFTSLGAFILFGSYIYSKIEGFAVAIFTHLEEDFASIEAATHWFRIGLMYQAWMLAPFLAMVFVGAFAINALQVGFLASLEPMTPKWNKLNIFNPKNFKKFFDLQAIMRLTFGLSKMMVVGIITYMIIRSKEPEIVKMIYATAQEIFVFILSTSFYIGVVVAIILIVLGVFDFVYQKWKFSEDMKMSKQEVKDERRQSEGDVHVKGKMRAMMQSFIRTRMKEQVPKADVIIANPVHYAIAIKYDAEKLAAPICLAKGMRKMALAIRELGEEHGVPVVENPPLAQALYKVVEVGSFVPPEFYQSIAEVLAYVYRMDEDLKKRAGVE